MYMEELYIEFQKHATSGFCNSNSKQVNIKWKATLVETVFAICRGFSPDTKLSTDWKTDSCVNPKGGKASKGYRNLDRASRKHIQVWRRFEMFCPIHTTVGPVLLRGATETPLSPTGRCHGAVALKSLQRMESKCQGSEQSSTEFIYHFILTKASFRETFYFICHFEIISVVFLNA